MFCSSFLFHYNILSCLFTKTINRCFAYLISMLISNTNAIYWKIHKTLMGTIIAAKSRQVVNGIGLKTNCDKNATSISNTCVMYF